MPAPQPQAAQPASVPAPTAPADQAAAGDINANGAVSPSAQESQPAVTAAQPAAPSSAPVTPLQAANAQVKVYDTTSQPLAALLSQAQQDGATLVVGPLLKENVDQLSASTTTLNVLALNQPETPKDNLNICYFALSPEDEARDAARHIWEQQKRQPLLLVRAAPSAIASPRPLTRNGRSKAGKPCCVRTSAPPANCARWSTAAASA